MVRLAFFANLRWCYGIMAAQLIQLQTNMVD